MRMNKNIRLPLAAFLVMLLMTLISWGKQRDLIEVSKVFDGDTIELKDGRKIRLIGVDAPEVDSPYAKKEPFGDESKAYLVNLLLGKKVSIRVGEDPKDRFGRTLAYVYLGDVLVNGRIIRDGFAQGYEKFDYEYKDLFKAYEREAKARGIGIWKGETLAPYFRDKDSD
jgi:micrococcal nuclease